MADSLKSAAKKRKSTKGLSPGAQKRMDALSDVAATAVSNTKSVVQSTTSNLQSALTNVGVASESAQSSSVAGLPVYTGLSQVPHGLSLPDFDVNKGMPTDLTTVSPSQERTTKAVADHKVQAISEQRQTERVAQEQIGLITDKVQTGIAWRKLEGKVIEYSAEHVRNEQKFINLHTEYVNRDIAGSRFLQARERLEHSNIALEGLRGQTPHLREEWKERINLAISKTNDVKIAALKAEDRVRTERASLPPQVQDNLD